MSEPDLVFIVYPEIYAVLVEGMRDKRWTGDEYRRVLAFVSAWDHAIGDHGDRLAKLNIYSTDGVLSFHAFESAWDGNVVLDEDE